MAEQHERPEPAPERSPWSPLRVPAYRNLWLASLASNLGTWMHNVGATWLMTSLTTSTTLVALVQSAAALPTLFLAIFAGALADVVDRRRLLIATQLFSFAAVLVLALLAFAGLVTPWVLLGLTLALGVGTAFYVPASQAITPELVAREDLPSAVALGGVSMNGARAIGPALGGALVAATSPAAVFAVNAVSFLGVAAAAFAWRREVPRQTLPAERLRGALKAGVRYARHSPAFRAVLARAALFVTAGSATMSLLPVISKRHLGLGALGFGGLLGCIGAGALVGAVLLPRLRRRLGPDGTVVLGGTVFGLGAALVGVGARLEGGPAYALIVPALLASGVAWITTLATLNTAAQTSVPAWVRGRALGLYSTIFQGGMALGAFAFGAVADHLDAPTALLASAAALGLGTFGRLRWRLGAGDADLSPALHWPEPVLAAPAEHDDGPVLVTIEYEVAREQVAAFLRATRELEQIRRRDGSTLWAVFRDLERADTYLETFVVESWGEHLHQHARISNADLAAESQVRTYHRGPGPPRVRHLIAALPPP